MKAAALLSWIGRFFFLGLFYYFLYHVYRSITQVAQQSSGSARLIVLNRPTDPTLELWMEEHFGHKRKILKGKTIPIDGTFNLGRAAGNHLRTNDPYVSQSHFAILWGSSGYILKDLQSTNGTYVDGVRIAGTTRLISGCEITAGSWRFRFEVT